MKNNHLPIAILATLAALASLTALAAPGPACGADPLDELFRPHQLKAVLDIVCTIKCSNGSTYSCAATTCGETTGSSGERCLVCDGSIFHCCSASNTACRDECLAAYESCADGCSTRTCLLACRDERDLCLALC